MFAFVTMEFIFMMIKGGDIFFVFLQGSFFNVNFK